MTAGQRRYLELLGATPAPSIFRWMSRRGKSLVEARGTPDNWSHFQIITRLPNGRRKSATLPEDEHRELILRGFTAACTITSAGRRALSKGAP